MDEAQLMAARRDMSERTVNGKPLSFADLARMVEEEFDQCGLGDLLERMPTKTTILSNQVANRPHLHVICCPHCHRQAKIAECNLGRCNFPSESKSVNFPGSSPYDCQRCGKHFYASFGITDKLPSEIIFGEEKDDTVPVIA